MIQVFSSAQQGQLSSSNFQAVSLLALGFRRFSHFRLYFRLFHFSPPHFLHFILPHQDFFFSRGSVALISAPKITSHNITAHLGWLTPSASHSIPVQYTSQIIADPLSLMSRLYHFHSGQSTHSTTRERGTPERGVVLLRYRFPAVIKRARMAAPQMLLSRPIKSSVHLARDVAVELSLEWPNISDAARRKTDLLKMQICAQAQ